MSNLVSRFLKNESGATAIEYALIAAIMGVALIAIMPGLTQAIDKGFGHIEETLETKPTYTPAG